MKKFVIHILCFFSIIAVADYSFGSLGDYLQNHAKGGMTSHINNLVMIDKHDVLIMGSSRAHHHYDTPLLSEMLGMDVYNAGFDGNGVILAYGLLELIIERYKPNLIIYDVEPAFDINVYKPDNNHKRYISVLKPYFRHKLVGEVIKDVSTEEWYKTHAGLIRYNSSYISMIIDNLYPRPLYEKGYEPLYGIYEPIESKSPTLEERDWFKIKYVEKLIQLSEEHEIPMIVVASPIYGNHSKKSFLPVIELCNSHNIPFLDYYDHDDFIFKKEWFSDMMHLNSTGAREFSRMICNEISRIVKQD